MPSLFSKLSSKITEAALLALCIWVSATGTDAQAVNKVVEWNSIGSVAAATAGRGPATFIDLTYMHVAMYDAVAVIDGSYETFGSRPNLPGPASRDAAAAAAAYHVLSVLYPAQQASLQASFLQSLATIPDGAEKVTGIEVGADAAAQYMALRIGDGRNAPGVYTPGTGPGTWVPTPPAFVPGILPWIAQMQPFALDSPSQLRAEGPPRLDSPQYAEEYNEVKRLGSANSTDRTPEQTEAGLFYVDGAAGQSARAFRRLAVAERLDISDTARFFAMIYVSISDSLITTWDSKYHYGFWRPVTAIRAGDTDGNPQTEADPTWTPLAPTPPFPEYVSAHSSVAAAFSEAISSFFGSKRITITLDSVITGTTRTFHNTDDLVKDVANARVYAGFHFRSACIHGQVIGKQVAQRVARRHFRPLKSAR